MPEDYNSQLPDSAEALQIIERAELNGAVKNLITNSIAGEDNLAFRESLDRKLDAMRKELAGPSPNSVEALLIDRVVACWLQVQEADLRYAHVVCPNVVGNCNCRQRLR